MESHDTPRKQQRRHGPTGPQISIYRCHPHNFHLGGRSLEPTGNRVRTKSNGKGRIPSPTENHRRTPWQQPQKLVWIANIEPLQDKLDNISRCWAAKARWTGDTHIRAFLNDPPGQTPLGTSTDSTPNTLTIPWHGTDLHTSRDSPISEGFYLTAIQPEECSYGDLDDNLMDKGWRICYTDGTGGTHPQPLQRHRLHVGPRPYRN